MEFIYYDVWGPAKELLYKSQKLAYIIKRPGGAMDKFRQFQYRLQMQWRDRSTSKYYMCSKCHQQIRVPKGKGKIEIRCPKCSNRFMPLFSILKENA